MVFTSIKRGSVLLKESNPIGRLLASLETNNIPAEQWGFYIKGASFVLTLLAQKEPERPDDIKGEK